MPISKDQARDLAKTFHDLSAELHDFRFQNWKELSAPNRQDLEDAAWTLENYSSDFTTSAVGIILNDMKADLKAISDATAKAKKVIATINTIKDVLKVTSAAIVLGGAIASKNPLAIVSAADDLLQTAGGVLEKQGPKK